MKKQFKQLFSAVAGIGLLSLFTLLLHAVTDDLAILKTLTLLFTVVVLVLVAYAFYRISSFNKSDTKALDRLENITAHYLNKYQSKNQPDASSLINFLDSELRQFTEALTSDKNASGTGSLYMQLSDLKGTIEKTRKRDQDTIWISSGIANASDILRANASDPTAACEKLLSYLIKYLNTQVGAIYLHESSDSASALTLKACYAYGKRRVIDQQFDTEENLIGQCFLEKQMIKLTQVPADYLKVTSGLGEARPQSLILVPLTQNEITIGVLELASFSTFGAEQIEFLEKLSGVIASSMLQAQTAEQTQKLLALSHEQAEQMRASEEELRQNMEELQSTQEAMQRQMEEVSSVKQELEKERYLFEALMNHLPDSIYYKDQKSKLIRVSKSMADHFKTVPEKLIGKSDFDFQDEEHASKAFEDEMNIMRSRKAMVDMMEKETRFDGTEVWVSTTKMPLYNTAREVVGTFGISRNVSHFKAMEKKIQELEEKLKERSESTSVSS